MKKNQHFKMRGTKREEFISYFIGLGGKAESNILNEVTPDAGMRISHVNWSVLVEEERQGKVGFLIFPDVDLTLEVEEEIFDGFVRDFRLKFITAGG
ncbi:MAG: hypothetical protein HGA49_05100 [Eubacteriaceae bacterium]|nr:hypothetical protein [Eubacteriaceae bacterium]